VDGNRALVALDVAPVRDEPAGVGIYVAQLAAALSRVDPQAVSLIGVRPEARSLDAVSGLTPRLSFSVPRAAGGPGSYHAWMHLQAGEDARSTGARLAHFTNGAAPLIGTLPYVLTVHDLSIMRMPHVHPVARLATIPFALAAIARARAVIVPSDFVRRELMRGLRVSPQRVVAVEHAASAVDEAPDSGAALGQLGLESGSYLLNVGTLEPRKNLVRLIGAFERVGQELPDLKLVLVGASGWRRGAIDRRIAESNLRDRILVAGYLPAPDVTTLIGNAGALCYVSVYEGYGLPVIEALAVGAAVVTSNRTGMVQAAGGAAVLVDPYSESDIARGIKHALDCRSELITAGKERAARRSWDDSAAEHLSVYRWAAQRS